MTLIELIVVLVIVLVLSAIALSSMVGGRGSANDAVLRASALSVNDAIKSFRRDHASRAPVFGSTTDWPTARASFGPIDRQGDPYMRKRDDELASGAVQIVTGTTGGGTTGRLRYVRPSTNNYTLFVERRAGATWVRECWYGTTDPGGGLDRC